MRQADILLGLVSVVFASGSIGGQSGGQSVNTLLRQGDPVVGFGALEGITYVAATDSGDWTALIDTDFFDASRDGALMRNGFVALPENTSLFDPLGYRLDEWISLSPANTGHLGMLLRVRQAGDPEDDVRDGAFWNLVPVAMYGDLIADPGAVPATAAWEEFDVVKLNARNELFVLGGITLEPGGATQDALVRYRLGATGAILETTVLATEGTLIPPLETVVTGFLKAEHVLQLNNKGDFITFVGALGTDAILINLDTVVAQRFMPSPVPGRTWRNFIATKVSINDRRGYALSGTLNGSTDDNYLIVKNGEKFAQSGDLLPALSEAPLSVGLAAPIVLSNAGDVYWSPRFDAAEEEAFARNHELIVRRGQVLPDGTLVEAIPAAANGFGVSPDGRFFVGRVELEGDGSAIVYADFGLVLELPGCAGNPGTLQLESGKALVGGRFALALDHAQAAGAIPALTFATRPAREGSECGIPTPFGEFLLSPPSIRKTLVLPPWSGAPTVVQFDIPNQIALVDARFFAQGAFFDPSVPSPEKYRLTNGLRIEFGPP